MSEVERLEKESHTVSLQIYLHLFMNPEPCCVSSHIPGVFFGVGSADGTED